MIHDCVIFDLDGTLSNMAHRMPLLKDIPPEGKADFDWDNFNRLGLQDEPYWDIFELLKAFYNHGLQIVISTARPEKFKWETLDWFFKHLGFQPKPHEESRFHIYMRGNEDFRSDWLVKEDSLHNILRKFNPLMALDDRDRVVQMYRDNGIRCLQVSKGEY